MILYLKRHFSDNFLERFIFTHYLSNFINCVPAYSPLHSSKIWSFWTRLTETLLPLHGCAAQLPRCTIRARESMRGSLFRSKKFKCGQVSFLRTRTFIFSFPTRGSARLYIVRVVETARTSKKGPASGIYGFQEEEASRFRLKFHSLRTMHFRACIATTKLELRACNFIALLKQLHSYIAKSIVKL